MSLEILQQLNARLDAFLAKEIAIPATARSRAFTAQVNLRGILRGKEERDADFPFLLHSLDSDFIGGSFARHTKIWPLDDIDVYIPLDGAELHYLNGGLRLPFSVVTDNPLKPSRINCPKWYVGSYISSRLVLEGFRDALSESYPNSDVSADNHCVVLGTSIAATSESDGIGFDVVPCFSLIPDDGSAQFYLVPDGAGGWMRSNPRWDTELCAQLNLYHHETYRKAVRLVKYWNKTKLSNIFSSYYIELSLCNEFSSLRSKNESLWFITSALRKSFEALKASYSAGNITSLITAAPSIQKPSLSLPQLTELYRACTLSAIAADEAYENDNLPLAKASLNVLLGTEFFS